MPKRLLAAPARLDEVAAVGVNPGEGVMGRGEGRIGGEAGGKRCQCPLRLARALQRHSLVIRRPGIDRSGWGRRESGVGCRCGCRGGGFGGCEMRAGSAASGTAGRAEVFW